MVAAAAILAAFSVLFIQIEVKRQHAAIEYRVFQIMTGIVETWSSDSSFDPRHWPDVTGFGVYRSSGISVYRYGTAPAYLEREKMNRTQVLLAGSGTTMMMVRQLGFIPPMHGGFGMDLLNAPPPKLMDSDLGEPAMRVPGMMGDLANNPMRGPGGRYAFIEINVASLMREGWLVISAVAVAFALFFGIVFLVVSFTRTLQSYRIREQESAHLVQLGGAARTLAHEIKNPLGVIRVQCATLRRTVPADRHGNIAVIEEETARLTTLADRVRDFLHTSTGNPRPCEAMPFLGICRERYEGKILVENAPAGPVAAATVFIDPDRMMQILDNLIVNALDASETAAGNGADGEGSPLMPELSLSVQRGTVSYTVSDSGCGIAPENRKRLFEPFFTTKARGSGIGLALARRFAEQAGGTLSYMPRPGGGSVFTLTLPQGTEPTRFRGA